jgi:cytochrome c-type biogenesis protein CcmH
MKRALRLCLIALALIAAAPAFAVQPDEMLSDPALEARARALSRELRCMVCQNQSIDDSAAPLARDLRLLVRERLTAGDTDQQVLDFLVDRYGAFVLLKPRLGWDTAQLWFAPLLVLVLGGCGLLAVLRRSRSTDGTEPAQLTAAERGRLAELLGEDRGRTDSSS